MFLLSSLFSCPLSPSKNVYGFPENVNNSDHGPEVTQTVRVGRPGRYS
jgi:hypothetical protein